MITQKELKRILHYNPETGDFTWKVSYVAGQNIGQIADTTIKIGYSVIKINNRVHFAHRLAFLYMTGVFPENTVDHIDHNRANNVWSNLISVTHKINMKNQSKAKNNSSGMTGVIWHKLRKKWQAYIRINKKRIHLGNYNTEEEAHEIYQKALDLIDKYENNKQFRSLIGS